jgi:protocadherin alpha
VKKEYQEVSRCDTLHRMKVTGCEKDIFEPIDKTPEAIIEPNKIIDVISVHLLPGMTRNITLSFSLLAHPIDLYYLMDFSGSMGGDKANLVTLASKLMTTMRNITEDYRLGLGSFIDKPVAPFGTATESVIFFRKK